MRKTVSATAIVLALCLLPASGSAKSDPGGEGAATAAAKKFFVAVAPTGGGHKVKVGKILRVSVRCSLNCKVKVRFKLITPVGSSTVKGGRYLPKGVPWQTGMVLTKRGKRALKSHVKTSRLAARVTAVNSKTGKRSVRTKLFKLRR